MSTQAGQGHPSSLDDLAGSYTVGYGYDRADHQTTVSYPAVGGLGAETVTTSFSNVTGTPVAMAGTDQYVFSTSFDNRNRVTQRVLGNGTNGVKRTYGFDTHQRTTSWVATDMANVVIQSDQYTIDPVGNVTQRHDAVAGQRECYGYDQRNRLTRAYTTTNTACGTANTGGPDPYDHTYSYAPDGKMLARDEGAGPVAYTYPTQGPGSVRPHAVSAIGTDTYTYDPNGQMTSRPGDTAQQTLGWNPEHQLVEITEGTDTNGFVYDADGTRLVRVTPDDTTIYFADHELIDTSTSTVEARRTYVMGSAAVGVRSDSGLDWLLGDMLGSMSLLVNAAAGTVTRRRYLPYGNQRGTIDWTSLDRGWIGQTHDQTTGLHYLNARYYDPTAGRFLSVDPFGLKSDSATWDGYGYSFANPVSSMDATGLWGEYGYDQWGAAVQAHLDVAMNPALSQPQSPSRSSRHALERAMDIAGIETEIISAFTAGFDRWNLEVWSLEVNQRRLFVFSDGNATAIFAASDRATLVVVQRVPTNLAAYASAIGNSVTAAGYVVTAASLMYAAYEGWEASEGQPLPDRVVASVDAAAPAAVQIGIDWGAFRVGSAACSAGGPIVSGLCGVGAIVSERAVIDLYNGERSHHSFCRGGVARVDEINSMGFHHAPEQVQGCAG